MSITFWWQWCSYIHTLRWWHSQYVFSSSLPMTLRYEPWSLSTSTNTLIELPSTDICLSTALRNMLTLSPEGIEGELMMVEWISVWWNKTLRKRFWNNYIDVSIEGILDVTVAHLKAIIAGPLVSAPIYQYINTHESWMHAGIDAKELTTFLIFINARANST